MATEVGCEEACSGPSLGEEAEAAKRKNHCAWGEVSWRARGSVQWESELIVVSEVCDGAPALPLRKREYEIEGPTEVPPHGHDGQ